MPAKSPPDTIAPDHEKIKSLQNNLRTVLEHPAITFLGNVHVGQGELSPERLLELYHAVVYCVGAATDPRNSRSLAISEILKNRSFKFPATVISSTGYPSSPFEIHNPDAPRE